MSSADIQFRRPLVKPSAGTVKIRNSWCISSFYRKSPSVVVLPTDFENDNNNVAMVRVWLRLSLRRLSVCGEDDKRSDYRWWQARPRRILFSIVNSPDGKEAAQIFILPVLEGTHVAELTCAGKPSSDVYCWSCRLLPQRRGRWWDLSALAKSQPDSRHQCKNLWLWPLDRW